MAKQRRFFLKSTAAAVAGLAMPCDNKASNFLVEEATSAGNKPQPASPAALPQVQLGNYKVSRLIIGGNPFYGYSHFNNLFSQHVAEWSTPDRVCQVLQQCEQNGINTWQFSHTERTISDLKRHRAEGGKLHWILLSHHEIEEDHRLIHEMAKLKPIGIVHHGGSAERKRRAGKLDQVRDFLKSVRDSGVMVGLSLHERECGRWADSAAGGGEQEGRLDNRERDLASAQIPGQAMIETAETVGRFGQAEVEGGQGVEVGFRIGWHGGFFLTLFFGRRIPVRCRGRGSFGLR